jgi:hypothetical protein
MATIDFINGTIVPPSWLNDVDALVYEALPPMGKIAWMASLGAVSLADLANTASVGLGDALVGVQRTSGIATTEHAWHEGQPFNAITDGGCAANGVTDDTAALQAAATSALAQKRSLYCPGGNYLLNGVAGSDTFANGLLIPFGTVNADPSDSLLVHGDAGLTRFKCGSDNMFLIRNSRNNVTFRDICLDSNGHTNVILLGVVPESLTQTTTLVSNSDCTIENVDRIGGPGVTGLMFQCGPHVGGADSGGFFHNIIGGFSNFVSGGRHVHVAKGITFGTDGNRMTRSNFIGQRLNRGNVGYHFECGSEISLIGCNENLIANGVTPLVTPTARYVGIDCSRIQFVGGLAEGCTLAVDAFADNVFSNGYHPGGGSDVPWRSFVSAYDDGISTPRSWTPILNSTGGGAQGAATSIGRVWLNGKIVHFTCQISAAKGTLGAGSLSVAGMPFIADSDWAGPAFQVMTMNWAGITFTANVFTMVGRISGATLAPIKCHAAGAGNAQLTLAECSDPVTFTIHGFFKAV